MKFTILNLVQLFISYEFLHLAINYPLRQHVLAGISLAMWNDSHPYIWLQLAQSLHKRRERGTSTRKRLLAIVGCGHGTEYCSWSIKMSECSSHFETNMSPARTCLLELWEHLSEATVNHTIQMYQCTRLSVVRATVSTDIPA